MIQTHRVTERAMHEKDEQSTPRGSITQSQLNLRAAGSISDRCKGEKGNRNRSANDRASDRGHDLDRMAAVVDVPPVNPPWSRRILLSSAREAPLTDTDSTSYNRFRAP